MKRLNNFMDDGTIGFLLGIFAGLFLGFTNQISNWFLSVMAGLAVIFVASLLVSIFTAKPEKKARKIK